MEVSVQGLRARLEPFLYERGGMRYRFAASLAAEIPWTQLYSQFRELGEPESFACVREAAARAQTDERERALLQLFLGFLADEVENARAAPAWEEQAALERNASIAIGNEKIPLRAARALGHEADRGRREAIERALGDWFESHRDAWARQWELAPRVAAELGFSSYLALREAVTPGPVQPLASQCEVLLRATEDAYRDVLGYALKKLDPTLRALPQGPARAHDLARARVAPWLAADYRREDLLPSAQRWMGDLGLEPNACGRLQIDSEPRADKLPLSHVEALQLPDEVRLLVQPSGGLDAFRALASAFGRAQAWANTTRAAPAEERWLGDASVHASYGTAFSHALLDEDWHKRYLRLTQSSAKDGARLCALSSLAELRSLCAKLPYELSLFERGPLPVLAEAYEDRLSAALFVGVPRGLCLVDVEPRLASTRRLRGFALELRLSHRLRERFDQDWWRNPAAGRWLKEQFARGGREDADALSAQWGGPLSLEEAGRRLVDALNR